MNTPLWRIIGALALLLASLALVAQGRAGPVQFVDDFNDGNDDGWTQFNRSWHVLDGRYHLDGGYLSEPLTRGGWARTNIGDPTWTDYVYEFTFDTTNPPSAGNPDWPGTSHLHHALVSIRVQAAAEYRIDFWGSSDTGEAPHTDFVRNQDRLFDTHLATAPVGPQLGVNHGRVEATGGHFLVYLNEVLVLDVTDPDPIPYGGVAVGAHWEINTWFDDVRVTALDTTIPVAADIKPGSTTNPLNLTSKGVIPVAILSTASFDATTVDPGSVCFGDAQEASQRDCTEKHDKGHHEDVNGDGRLDLVLHYEMQQTGIDRGDTTACLTGATTDSVQVEGCDTIRVH